MAGERIGPAPEDNSLKGLLWKLRTQIFGDPYEEKVDAPTELARSQSDEFLNRNRSILDIIQNTPGLGLPTPTDAMGAQAVTQFATKADRIAALDKLNLEGRADDIQRAVFEFLKRRYPRVMAHNNRVGVAPLDKGTMGVNSPRTGIDEALGNRGVASITIDPSVKADDFAEALGHELNHTAQKLALGPRYRQRAVSSTTTGPMYDYNPLEVGSRKAGEKVKRAWQSERGSAERRVNRTEDRTPADWAERAAGVDPNGPLFTMPMSELRAGVKYDPEGVWQQHMGELDWDALVAAIRGK